MNTIEWTLEGNSSMLKLGAECLVELITQCETHFYAFILTKPYAISCKYWGREMYTVTYKSNKIATLYHKKGNSTGNIDFNNKISVNYQYHPKKGLSIFFKNFTDDAIIYKRNTEDTKQAMSVRIGIEMTNLDMECLLLLITLGKLLYDYFLQEEQAEDMYNTSSSFRGANLKNYHLS